MEVKIGSMVQSIGKKAFAICGHLQKIEFDETATLSHQLVIDDRAFDRCSSLPRIKLPSSVTAFGKHAFDMCRSLVEANLSRTCITEVSFAAFHLCTSLQTVCLPNTLERICDFAFSGCWELVTVVVPLDALKPITIGERSFCGCRRLANLVLPKDSVTVVQDQNPDDDSHPFADCATLHACFGRQSPGIVAGLIGRFEADDKSVHRMCYDHSGTTAEDLQRCIEEQDVLENSFLDAFGMTPFHVLFSSPEPSAELLDVLFDRYPYQKLLNLEDANGKRPLDYLVRNWTRSTATLLERTLKKWVVDPVESWGATLWMEAMETKVEAVHFEHDKELRVIFLNQVYPSFQRYEKLESTSVLEIALWKGKLKSGRRNDGFKRQALDPEACRCVCGSDVVIPNVTQFLWG